MIQGRVPECEHEGVNFTFSVKWCGDFPGGGLGGWDGDT